MTKSTITREESVQAVFDLKVGYRLGFADLEILKRVARMALSAMDIEPHTDDELSNLLWYSQEATCHSDPNYYCEFQRLATPGLIAGIIRELQERRKADSEPVAWLLSGGGTKNVVCFDSGNAYADPLREVTPLYRHAQPAPVVPEEKSIPNTLSMYAVDAVAAIAEVKGWNACRAAMLAAAPQSPGSEPATVPGKWIPVSERMPDCWCRTCRPVVLNDMRFVVCPDCGNKRCPRANDHRNACTGSNEPGQEGSAYTDTPREVKP